MPWGVPTVALLQALLHAGWLVGVCCRLVHLPVMGLQPGYLWLQAACR